MGFNLCEVRRSAERQARHTRSGGLTVANAKSEGVYRKPSMVFSISKNSKDPKAAAQIINCLLNDPEAIKILGDFARPAG